MRKVGLAGWPKLSPANELLPITIKRPQRGPALRARALARLLPANELLTTTIKNPQRRHAVESQGAGKGDKPSASQHSPQP